MVISIYSFTQAANFFDSHSDGIVTNNPDGTNWVENNGSGMGESGGGVTAAANGQEIHMINDNSCAPAGTLNVVLNTNYASGVEERMGILFKWTGITSYYYMSTYKNGTNYTFYFSKNSMPVGSGDTSFTGAGTDPLNIKLIMNGSSHELWVDGSSIGTYTEATHDSGSVGYGHSSTWGCPATFDSISWVDVVSSNNAPTDISLSPTTIYENLSTGTYIGKFTTTDADAGDSHTYSFATGGTDNASFTISNDSLFSGAVYDYSVKNSYSIKIRTTDNGTGNLWFEKIFGITILEVENVNDWASSMVIYINTTATGANVSTDQYNFPLLVRLDPSNFTDFANTNVAGADIRFTKSDGTFLSYEKERWIDGVSDADTAVFWVKVDTVLGNNSEQFIKMWWNKASETTTSNSSNVFDTSDNFAGVWHLTEEVASTGNVGAYADATSNSNDADDYVSATGQDAVAKNGQGFDGTDDYVSIPQSASLDITGDITMSGWFKLDANFTSATASSDVILTKNKNNDNNMVITLVGTDYDLPLISDGSLAFKVECRDKYTGAYKFVWTNTTSWTAGTWYYYTVVIDADNSANNKIYIDGVNDTN